jgi:hypothetical protein
MLTGIWSGTLVPSAHLAEVADDRYPIVLALEETEGSVTGTAGPSAAEIDHARIAVGTFNPTMRRVHIRIDSPPDAEVDEHIVLEGDVTLDAMSGHFEYGTSGSGEFQLRRIP